MALTVSFTASQSSGIPGTILLTDTSSGTDGTITSRLITILDAEGTTTTYPWAYANSTISLAILTEDTALKITVGWLNSGNTAVYTSYNYYCFTAYNETFYYGLSVTETPITNPSVSLSTDYFKNKLMLRCFIDSASQAISFAQDLTTAQTALEAATNLSSNENFYF